MSPRWPPATRCQTPCALSGRTPRICCPRPLGIIRRPRPWHVVVSPGRCLRKSPALAGLLRPSRTPPPPELASQLCKEPKSSPVTCSIAATRTWNKRSVASEGYFDSNDRLEQVSLVDDVARGEERAVLARRDGDLPERSGTWNWRITGSSAEKIGPVKTVIRLLASSALPTAGSPPGRPRATCPR